MDTPLTDRQLEVLHLKAGRHTNAEIAEQLVISITTVKWHIRQIYNKLGANNRAEAISIARQAGLLQQKQLPPKQPQFNYPTPSTPFIGRNQELHHLKELLNDPDTRLVTLMGLGGIGKTRLALQTARLMEDNFSDGICWVPFSGRDEGELIFTTVSDYLIENILTALKLPTQGSDDLKGLLRRYLDKREFLIILDGFESLLTGASFISELLAGTTACKFLITSRERLHIPGEVLFTVQGLPVTQEADVNPEANDAVNLFLQTASRVSDSDILADDFLPTIQRICAHLEGLPLAIELAADWTRLLPIDEIEQELEQGFSLLDIGTTGIRSVFDRSWNQLTDPEQASFSRLAVFQNSFTREAAEQVADADLERLSKLYDKSLIEKVDEGRYALHDLWRHYLVEHLTARAERDKARDTHCAYFAELVAGQTASIASGDHSKVLADLDNIRATWLWAAKRRRLENLHKMLLPLDWFYNLRAYYLEGMAAWELAVDSLQMKNPEGLQGIVYGRVLVHYGLEKSIIKGVDEARSAVNKGIAILRQLGSPEDLAWPLILSVFVGITDFDTQLEEQNCQEALEIFEELNNPIGMAFSLSLLGTNYRKNGRFGEAQQSIERGLAVSRSIGDLEGTAYALRNLGHLNLHLGHFETAWENFKEEAALWEELSLPRVKNEALRFLGEASAAAGQLKEAEQLFLESLAEFEQIGDDGNTLRNLLDLGNIALQQGQTKKAHELLHDIRTILERRNANEESARFWQLEGQIYLHQGDLEAAYRSFQTALENNLQSGGTSLLETFLDFADYYQSQIDPESAARLLGFVQSKTGLPAVLVNNRINPLRASLEEEMGEESLANYLAQGAALDQKDILDMIRNRK
jgi:predicted ATPase/DNA-binding CsgD family transcriptional regulator